VTPGDTVSKPLRADAERNRQRILETARELFAERGLEAGVEQIAERAGVGMGTVYRHFPTKAALVDAILDERLQEVERIAEDSVAVADPWQAFTTFLERVLLLQADDRSFREIVAARRGDARLAGAWARARPYVELLVTRAQEQGALRADVTFADIPPLLWATGRVIELTVEAAPEFWRRHLGLLLDGLRAERAAPLARPPLTRTQLARAMQRGRKA
jgi:AcrR family transcriptional regulator